MAKELSQQNCCADSNVILKTIDPNKVDSASYHFHKLFNEYRMNDREAALKTARYFDSAFYEMPLRYQHVAWMMIEELKQWQKEDLGDIARDMKHVQDRLGDAKGDQKTREIQDEIVRKLDKHIKEMEDQAKAQAEAQAKAQAQARGQQPAAGDPIMPMPDSVPGGTSGPGKIDPKEYRSHAAEWGQMPEKERAKAMMRRVAEMPATHRKMIEDYYKKVAQESVGKK